MKRLIGLSIMLVALATGMGTVFAAPTPPPQAQGALKTADGQTIGNVLLTQLNSGQVFVSAAVKGLPPGEHGFTLRERGACTPDFNAAGGVYRSDDLPKLEVMVNGSGTLSQKTDKITVTPGAKSALDADGTAVIITAFGDESNKVACAVLAAVPVPVPAPEATGATQATAEFKTAAGETVGTATLTQNVDGSVRVQAQVRGMPEGLHGFHLHQFGSCAPTFGAAGEHFNPTGTEHGFENPNGPHAGDLPNLVVNADGTGTYDTTTNRVTLTPGDATLLDSDGTGIIIHAYGDDGKSDPGGNSGPRIACAVIQASASQPAAPAPQPQPVPQPQPAPQPVQLPNTGNADLPWLLLAAAALLLLGSGMLVRRKLR